MSDLQPIQVLSAITVLNSSLSDWSLLDIPAEGPRSYRQDVSFEQPFGSVPVVHVAIVGLDVGSGDNVRLRVRAVDIGPAGFSLVAETWFNTQVWGVEISWLAIGH